MSARRWFVKLTLFLLAAGSFLVAEDVLTLTADQIMARVAANQDRAVEMRKQYVYKQHVHVVTHRTNGKLMREETADYEVMPTPHGTDRNLKSLTGRYLRDGRYHDFQGEPRPDAESLDAQLVNDFRDDATGNKEQEKSQDDKSAQASPDHKNPNDDSHNKDGISKELFPLSSERQKDYAFQLLGEQMFQGREVYHIAFRPKDKEDFDWAGEAYIDKTEFEPILVFTKLSRRIPFAVRTFLGTDVPGVGFSVQYKRLENGVWFPSSYGTEFRLKVLFFLKRDISVALDNRDFEQTHVDSKIEYAGPAQ